MAHSTGRIIVWKGGTSKTLLKQNTLHVRRGLTFRKKMHKPSIKIEDLGPLKMRQNSGGKFALTRQLRQANSLSRSLQSRYHAEAQQVRNKKSAVFVCCSRRDAVKHARVLRSELAVKLRRECAVGGGSDSAGFVEESDAFIVLRELLPIKSVISCSLAGAQAFSSFLSPQ